ncbi:hypothetical protein [Bergeyella sp. RCAD1439]|uniref:hypothetical protein n=1 Tax=Bergeyella anatis TaxID=3113737 RepID=UPI002E18E4BB|nr:hypothetical protein [Bergeyella sp. RCAD1439]
MNRILNILVLMLFLNSLALPSLAGVLDMDLRQTNTTVSEEEIHHGSCAAFSEKTLPKTLYIKDFIGFWAMLSVSSVFVSLDEKIFHNPFYFILSPPPEWKALA